MIEDKNYYRGNKNLKAENIDLEYSEDQISEILKCKEDPIYFIRNYTKIVCPKGLVLCDLRSYQEKMVNLVHNNNKVIMLAPRQSGKTTSIATYIAHYVIFNKFKTVAIIANKEDTAKEIFDRVQLIFEYLPIWLKPGVKEWNKKSMDFDNGCSVIIGSTSSSSISGKSINLLYIDEVALISKKMAEAFFNSVLPVVAADENAKIVLSSTPKSLNHFYKMWKNAENGVSGYIPLRVYWNEPPGRDESYKQQIIKAEGIEHWTQEYACVCGKTLITIRNKITKKISHISIEDFYKSLEKN